MNRRITAIAIASVAILGLAGCSSSSDEAADDQTTTTDESTEEAAPAGDQSVEDACGIIIPELTEASSAVSGIDYTTAAEDPQGTVDQFNEVVTALGETADKITNEEVKPAVDTLYDSYSTLGELLQKVLVDQDTSAASDLTALQTDLTEAATTLGELCS